MRTLSRSLASIVDLKAEVVVEAEVEVDCSRGTQLFKSEEDLRLKAS